MIAMKIAKEAEEAAAQALKVSVLAADAAKAEIERAREKTERVTIKNAIAAEAEAREKDREA